MHRRGPFVPLKKLIISRQMRTQNKYKRDTLRRNHYDNNNTNNKKMLPFILATIQTHTSFLWSALFVWHISSWKQKLNWVLNTRLVTRDSNNNAYGGPAGPQDTYNSVAVSRVKARVCSCQGHWHNWNCVYKKHFKTNRLRDVDGSTVFGGPSGPRYAF